MWDNNIARESMTSRWRLLECWHIWNTLRNVDYFVDGASGVRAIQTNWFCDFFSILCQSIQQLTELWYGGWMTRAAAATLQAVTASAAAINRHGTKKKRSEFIRVNWKKEKIGLEWDCVRAVGIYRIGFVWLKHVAKRQPYVISISSY
jgi:hypothetical protein